MRCSTAASIGKLALASFALGAVGIPVGRLVLGQRQRSVMQPQAGQQRFASLLRPSGWRAGSVSSATPARSRSDAGSGEVTRSLASFPPPANRLCDRAGLVGSASSCGVDQHHRQRLPVQYPGRHEAGRHAPSAGLRAPAPRAPARSAAWLGWRRRFMVRPIAARQPGRRIRRRAPSRQGPSGSRSAPRARRLPRPRLRPGPPRTAPAPSRRSITVPPTSSEMSSIAPRRTRTWAPRGSPRRPARPAPAAARQRVPGRP